MGRALLLDTEIAHKAW
jgi:hypothetical protein